jgi:hypothetical protein
VSLRSFLAAIFLFGSIGLAAELILVGHVDDMWQQIPLVLFGAGVATLVWNVARPSIGTQRLFRGTRC